MDCKNIPSDSTSNRYLSPEFGVDENTVAKDSPLKVDQVLNNAPRDLPGIIDSLYVNRRTVARFSV